MVKHRGIEINAVSQLGASKLPEFGQQNNIEPYLAASSMLQSDGTSTVSVYIPAHSNSQFWFQYRVEGPHPPKAIYLFKLLCRNQVICSWDTTEELQFQGMAMMALQYLGSDPYTGKPMVQRNVFQFATLPNKAQDVFNDHVEISIHRVEHRQRMRIEYSSPILNQFASNAGQGNMKLRNGGLLESAAPKKYYKYQLLDPVNSPYARFRFHFRTIEQLKSLGLFISAPKKTLVSSGSTSSVDSVDDNIDSRRASADSMATTENSIHLLIPKANDEDSTIDPREIANVTPTPSPSPIPSRDTSPFLRDRLKVNRPSKIRPARLNTNTSHRTSSPTKGLAALLKTPVTPAFLNPLRSSSPTKRRSMLKPAPLTLSLDGVEFDISRKGRRSLSPFTTAGILRKEVMSPTPPTAPPSVTTFTIEDEIAEMEALAHIQHTSGTKGKLKKKADTNDPNTKTARKIAAQPLKDLFQRAKSRKEKSSSNKIRF